ncbi:MAG TPA: universal stress protein [Polyangiaceae bacterium]|jgi:nucleotide-binding universal stress UspA family protein|nr:universal stress protein [Polyangiaceae bacterium]
MTAVRTGEPAAEIGTFAGSGDIDAIVMTTHGRSPWQRWLSSSTTSRVIYQTTPPLLLVRPTDDWRSTRTSFGRLVVALDGSETAEQVLPFVHALTSRFHGKVMLFSAAEGSESDDFTTSLREYLERLAADLRGRGADVRVLVEAAAPARAIVDLALSSFDSAVWRRTSSKSAPVRCSSSRLSQGWGVDRYPAADAIELKTRRLSRVER